MIHHHAAVFGGMAACLLQTAEAEIQRIQSTPLPVSMSPAMFHTYLAKRPKLDRRVSGAPARAMSRIADWVEKARQLGSSRHRRGQRARVCALRLRTCRSGSMRSSRS